LILCLDAVATNKSPIIQFRKMIIY
jgi:hypothetical protein